MVLSDLLARGAVDALGVEVADEPIEAGRVIREVLVELVERVPALGSRAPLGLVAIDLTHASDCSEREYLRQGDSYRLGGRVTLDVGPWVFVLLAGVAGLIPVDGRLAWALILVAGILGLLGY